MSRPLSTNNNLMSAQRPLHRELYIAPKAEQPLKRGKENSEKNTKQAKTKRPYRIYNAAYADEQEYCPDHEQLADPYFEQDHFANKLAAQCNAPLKRNFTQEKTMSHTMPHPLSQATPLTPARSTEQEESTPLFKNSAQALHFAFLMEVLPSTVKCSTQMVMDSLMRNSGREVGPHQSSINLAGLNPIERKAQCAMIRSAVNSKLPEPEKHAIWARFGCFDPSLGVRTLLTGIENMVKYIEPLCLVKGDALLELTCNFYRLKEANSMRAISLQYEIPTTNLARAKQVIGQHAARLELEATTRMNAIFKEDGLVG